MTEFAEAIRVGEMLFLRSRREQLRPEQVGLPSFGRRRTPGLRREELAALAGLSVEYLERLERGRDTNPSHAVLAALAEALQLSDSEKQHLATLAMKRHSAALLPPPRQVSDDTRPTVRTLLDNLDPTPASVFGPTCNVVAWNSAWEAVVRPLGLLDEESPNLIRYHFQNPMARGIFTQSDWAAKADELVGWLRAAQPDWGSADEFRALVDDLNVVSEFTSRWAAHPVAVCTRPSGTSFSHPDAGILGITTEVLLVGEAGQWLQMWIPADERTASAIKAFARATPPHAPIGGSAHG
ncbi:helix-turn-helix domain-containing protein [Streptomyces sp. NPDC052023]|uniref:helix-turn-helix domain-containing protein n=1 Tax=Streptomyces sp. NPDC052023 TaxID=3365681 RepID=UPI0037D13BAF